jgi:hypothetical protein
VSSPRWTPRWSGGSALVFTLIFLGAITLVAMSAVRTSVLSLKVAGNQQDAMNAMQTAQAVLDEVYALDYDKLPATGAAYQWFDLSNLVGTSPNATTIYAGLQPCTAGTLTGNLWQCTAPVGDTVTVRADLISCGLMPRSKAGCSVTACYARQNAVNVVVDRRSTGHGYANVVQGLMNKVVNCG